MVKRKLLVGGYLLLCNLLFILYLQKSATTFPVMMTDEGYLSNIITIQPGQKVIWRNMGNKARWPASNNHPTHTNYPSEEKGCLGSNLDACRPMNTGEEYRYVFDKPGSWGIHDHLEPGQISAVVVEDVQPGWLGRLQVLWNRAFSASNDVPELLPANSEFSKMSYDSQIEMLKNYAQEDPGAAWDYLKSAFIVDGEVVQPAHEFGHVVGNAAYAKYGVSGVRICDASFGYGCFHGVTELAVQQMASTADLKSIEQECEAQTNGVNQQNCYHGIGHGIASVKQFELNVSLDECDKLEVNNREFCYDGVMMEHTYGVENQQITTEDPWKICEELQSQYHKACGNYQSARLSVAGWGFEQIIKSCPATIIVLLEKQCARGVGYASVNEYWQEPEKIISQCAIALTQANNDWCLMAAASEFSFQAYNNWQDTANKLCNTIHREDFRRECYNEVKVNKQ